jgi:hypothetical protein
MSPFFKGNTSTLERNMGRNRPQGVFLLDRGIKCRYMAPSGEEWGVRTSLVDATDQWT